MENDASCRADAPPATAGEPRLAAFRVFDFLRARIAASEPTSELEPPRATPDNLPWLPSRW